MNQTSRVLRFVLPIPVGLALAGIIPILTWHPHGPVPALFYTVALIMWPRLWVLAPIVILDMYAYGQGASYRTDYTNLADNASMILMAIPLLCIGISSAIRRLPGPREGVSGTIVPNADGVGALLALPFVIGFSMAGQAGILFGGALLFALIRIIGYARKSEVFTRGRGWVAFAVGIVLGILYYVGWTSGDVEMMRYYVPKCVLPLGIIAWAIQRAVIPYRNPTTQP